MVAKLPTYRYPGVTDTMSPFLSMSAGRTPSKPYSTATRKAEKLGAESPDAYYPALNVIAADVIARRSGVSATRLKAVRDLIAGKLRDDPDFWSNVGDIELTLYEALNSDELSQKLG